MDSDALRVLDLMRKLRALHGCGSRDDAIALYRYIGDARRQIELANPWEGDEVHTAEAVEILLWMGQQAELVPFQRGWPDWLARWFTITHGPTALLKPLQFKQGD